MLYCNLLSQPAREGLLVVRTFLSLPDGMDGIGREEIARQTGLSKNTLSQHISKLLRSGWITASGKNLLSPQPTIHRVTLYDVIELFDGWVHIGNADIADRSQADAGIAKWLGSLESMLGDALKMVLSSPVSRLGGIAPVNEPLPRHSDAKNTHHPATIQ